MLNWFRLEILNPKGLERSIVYIRQCSSVIESPVVVTVLLSKANPTFPYAMVKQFYNFSLSTSSANITLVLIYLSTTEAVIWGRHLDGLLQR